MVINVSGHQIDISEGYKNAVHESINEISTKYKINAVDAQVTLSKSSQDHQTDINIHINKQLNIRISGHGTDAYTSLQDALHHLQDKIRKQKKRSTDHQRHHDTHFEKPDYETFEDHQQSIDR